MWFIKVIQSPTQGQILEATCGYSPRLAWNEEVHLIHWGEDGPGLEIERVREMFIFDQNEYSGDFQDWFLYERYDECDD